MNEIVENIIRLPAMYNAYGDISLQTLLSQTGYNDNYKNIMIKDILAGLNEDPVLADSWLTYSNDKRSRAGWYLRDRGDSRYQVGYYPETEAIPMREYTNLNQACAVFIKQELEDIRRR
jgi:predicted GNAT superfamily acetyltransferase